MYVLFSFAIERLNIALVILSKCLLLKFLHFMYVLTLCVNTIKAEKRFICDMKI